MSLTVDSRDFRRAAAAVDRFDVHASSVAARSLDQIAAVVQANVRAKAAPHRRTGKMSSLVRVFASGVGIHRVVKVHAGGRVAHLVTGGTAPHDISPIRSRALPIQSFGGALSGFAGSVHHPGTRPDPFVAAGVDASRQEIDTIAAAGAAAIAHDIGDEIRRS